MSRDRSFADPVQRPFGGGGLDLASPDEHGGLPLEPDSYLTVAQEYAEVFGHDIHGYRGETKVLVVHPDRTYEWLTPIRPVVREVLTRRVPCAPEGAR